jgi:hypothetical protein
MSLAVDPPAVEGSIWPPWHRAVTLESEHLQQLPFPIPHPQTNNSPFLSLILKPVVLGEMDQFHCSNSSLICFPFYGDHQNTPLLLSNKGEVGSPPIAEAHSNCHFSLICCSSKIDVVVPSPPSQWRCRIARRGDAKMPWRCRIARCRRRQARGGA